MSHLSWKKALWYISILGVFAYWSISLAQNTGVMTLSPSTGNLGMYCVNPIGFSISTDNAKTTAVDLRVIFDDQKMIFTGAFTGGVQFISNGGNYFLPTGSPVTGKTTRAINLPWSNTYWTNVYGGFSTGWTYYLINWNSPNAISGQNLSYATWYFQTTTGTQTGYLDFYMSGGWNGDDSNIQSGITNKFIDVLVSANSGFYTFQARPCIADTDAPWFTGYASGQIVNYLSGINFVITDFTGQRISGYNSTYHYWFATSPANTTNLANYVTVNAASGIDNQYGINTGTVTIYLSGIARAAGSFTGEGSFLAKPLITWQTITLSQSVIQCIPTVSTLDLGFTLTWERRQRGIDCSISLTGLNIQTNQLVSVTITGTDYQNYTNTTNTGSLNYSLTITWIDDIPPYIESSSYLWTGIWGNATTGAGPLFSIIQQTNWTGWTRNPVVINLTGSEAITIDAIASLTGSNLNAYMTFTGLAINQAITFTGNGSGQVLFSDGLGNIGSTFQSGASKYIDTLYVDVFWIDQITTSVTGSAYYTGMNGQLYTATLTLTGTATGNTNSILDDEFVIIGYSGTIQPNITYATGYSTGVFSLIHTGIIFNDNWSGDILYQDRAGNSGSLYTLISGINVKSTYTVKAFPGSRGINPFGTTGEFRVYNSSKVLVYTASVMLNTDGTGSFDYSLPGGTGYIVFKGLSHLAAMLSGYSIVPNSGQTFDFTTWLLLTGTQNKTITTNDGSGYLIAGDIKPTGGSYDFTINGNDVSIIFTSFGNGATVYDKENLNGDTTINGSDISVIGTNFSQSDLYYNPPAFLTW